MGLNPVETLKAERDRFVAFAFAAADLLLEVDGQGIVKFGTGAVGGLKEKGSLVGKPFSALIAESDRGYVAELLEGLVSEERLVPARIKLDGAAGRPLYALMGACRLPGTKHSYVSLTMSARFQASAGDAQDENGLLDKNGFINAAQRMLGYGGSTGVDQKLTLLVVDGLATLRHRKDEPSIDRFLNELSSYLRGVSVGGEAAGKLSGDSFGVVHAPNIDGAAMERRIQEMIDKDVGSDAGVGVKSFSMGLEAEGLNDDDATRALVYAVRRFAAGEHDSFNIASLASGAQSILQETLPRVKQLRDTIEKRTFDIVFQPIIDMNANKVHHFEALSRLVGMATPGEMIAFAEDIGMVFDFDLAVVQKVLENLNDQARSGWYPMVAVNVSARSLESNLFIDGLSRVTQPFGERSRQVMFEITETANITNFKRANQVIQRLRNSGHKVCLDDVGAGGTSFESLYGLKVDFAKIDGKCVRNAAEDDRHLNILKSIVSVCQDLKIDIVAEQIEVDEQARLMTQLGIRFGQGYLYGRPIQDYRSHYGTPSGPVSRVRRQGATQTWG